MKELNDALRTARMRVNTEGWSDIQPAYQRARKACLWLNNVATTGQPNKLTEARREAAAAAAALRAKLTEESAHAND